VNEVQSGFWTVEFGGSYEQSREVPDDTFKSGSLKTRDPVELMEGFAGLEWARRQWVFDTGYEYLRERHDDPEFQSADKDEQTYTFGAQYEVNSRIATLYEYERMKTELINDPDAAGSGRWETLQFVGLQVDVLEDDPNLAYTFGYEKDDTW